MQPKQTMEHLYNINNNDAPLYAKANELGVMTARIAIESGTYSGNILGVNRYWDDPVLTTGDSEAGTVTQSLLSNDLLSELARSISATIQFPVNTIFAHGLGIVASAMSKSFSFEYGSGTKPVNLYVVCAQPPSSGKSGVNEILSEPVHHAFDSINKTAALEKRKIKIKIAANKRQSKDATTKEEQYRLEEELLSLYEDNEKHTTYLYAMDDATPEAVAKIALNQKGVFNIISAEADAINVILGGVYSDKKSNFGIFLKGFDAERHIVARSGQETMSGHVVGCIAVIAQDESIKTILQAGESGRGISERFLMVREDTLLGTRNFGKPVPLDKKLSKSYSDMIFNIVREKGVTLKFNSDSIGLINSFRSDVEAEMGDHGAYSNNMLRGFVGKADKQIMKMASILHTIDNWQVGGEKSTRIKVSTVKQAIKVFKIIMSAYTSAADELGFTGDVSEYKKVEERILAYAEKGKFALTVSQLRDNIKSVKPFSGTPKLTAKLRHVILPALESFGLCIAHEDKIYINPKLRGG